MPGGDTSGGGGGGGGGSGGGGRNRRRRNRGSGGRGGGGGGAGVAPPPIPSSAVAPAAGAGAGGGRRARPAIVVTTKAAAAKHPRDTDAAAPPKRQRNKRGGRSGGGSAAAGASVAAPKAVAAPVPVPGGGAGAGAGAGVGVGVDSTVLKSYVTDTRFDSLADRVEPEVLAGVSQGFGYTHMTRVQEATLFAGVAGKDILAKARTGTGKTLGFLIPVVQALQAQKWPAKAFPGAVGCLVLSPARELAMQIAREAEILTSRIPDFTVHCVYGGVKVDKDKRAFARKPRCDVLVATPGRIIDHLSNPGFADRFASLQTLVLDECDQLLDMGFRPAINRIISLLSRSAGKRQTLLYSATVPPSVMEVVRSALKPDYISVDTVGKEDNTHAHVDQYHVTIEMEDMFPMMLLMLRSHIATVKDYKVLVFFPTARMAGFACQLFNAAGLDVLEIHSRKSQSARTAVSNKIRHNTNVIVFSSDVSGRGVDYPDISLVVQMGTPSSAEQYVHRLGRTARAGKGGEGVILLAPFESALVRRKLSKLPLKALETLPPADAVAAAAVDIRKALARMTDVSRGQAYQSWLGYYNSVGGLKVSKPELVALANRFATVGLGCPPGDPPALLKSTVGKMGLRGTPGLNIVSALPGGGGGGRGRGRGGGGGRAGRAGGRGGRR